MRKLVFSASLLLLATTTASAEDAASDTDSVSVNAIFGKFGFHSDTKIDGTNCTVRSTLDHMQFVDAFPTLQRIQMMNPDITQTELNLKPNTLAMAFSVNMMPVTIKDVYDNHKQIDKCHFAVYIKLIDDYGNNKDMESMSFDFTRAINERVNWDNFEAQKIVRIAPHFAFTPAMIGAVAVERASAE